MVPKSPAAKRETATGRTLPRFYPVHKAPGPTDHKSPRKQKTRHSDNPPLELPVGWVMGVQEARSRTASFNGYVFKVMMMFGEWWGGEGR